MLEEYEVSTEDARALCAKVVEAVRRVDLLVFGFDPSSEIGVIIRSTPKSMDFMGIQMHLIHLNIS